MHYCIAYYNLIGYNINIHYKEVLKIKILKEKAYSKSLKKVIISAHRDNELKTLEKIERLIIQSKNMKELMLNPLHIIYSIEQKKEI